MMKKNLILTSFLLPMVVMAQNLQVHYDFGKERNYITTTFEMFKPDKWGNTFIFVDYDYNLDKDKNVGMAYMEIARCISFSKNGPLSAHIEYNGGFLGSNSTAIPINNAYLAGLDYGWHNTDFSKTANIKLLYKTIIGKTDASFQITGVWGLNYFKNKLTFSGFADFWKEDNLNFTDAQGKLLAIPVNTKYVFISEPQLWYNINSNVSMGTEVEVACNFGTVKGLKFCPTLAVKWNF
jgi:hypothetical protein